MKGLILVIGTDAKCKVCGATSMFSTEVFGDTYWDWQREFAAYHKHDGPVRLTPGGARVRPTC